MQMASWVSNISNGNIKKAMKKIQEWKKDLFRVKSNKIMSFTKVFIVTTTLFPSLVEVD